MEMIEFGEVTDEHRLALEGDEHDPFDAAGATQQFRGKELHVGLRTDDGRLVASAGLTTAAVEVGGERFDVVGLGGVIVAAPYRGQGLARQVVEAAAARSRAMGPEFIVLFCHANRMGLYERLGFEVIEGTVLVKQPGGYEPIEQRTMWRALTPGASWPSGRLVIHTLPF